MTGRGRPLRFLALVLLAWSGTRTAVLWSRTGSLPEALHALVPTTAPLTATTATATTTGPAAARAGMAVAVPLRPAPAAIEAVQAAMPARPPTYAPRPESDPRVQMALLGLIHYGAPEPVAPFRPAPRAAMPRSDVPRFVPQSLDRLDPLPDRWSASAWLVARGGMGPAAAPGGQIGGGQAGARVAWLLAPRRRVALFGRVAAPLAGRGAEVSLGLEWQPSRAPVRLVVERRFGLDGTPGGAGLGVVAGLDAETSGFRLEGYGQAGAIRRSRTEPYADGAVRGTRLIAAGGEIRLAMGAGAWGAAQRDAQRLDIGPSATLALRNLRFALDWRQRVAGAARPGSGPALTLGADF